MRGDTAGRFAVTLYQSILRGEDLDLALTAARISIDQFKDHDTSRGWDWALPYLRVTVPPDQVLGMAPVFDTFRQQAERVKEFARNRLFVDREQDRRNFLNLLQHDPGRTSNLLLVKVRRKVGKTQFIRCCLQHAATRGRLIKYVQLGGDGSKKADVLSLVRLICEGDPQSLIEKPLPKRAMLRFYQVLNALLDGKDATKPQVIALYPPKPLWYLNKQARQIPENRFIEDPFKLLLEEFLKALKAVPSKARRCLARQVVSKNGPAAVGSIADERPFLIVIDPLTTSNVLVESFQQKLIPHLIEPMARGIQANLVLVLGVDDGAFKSLGFESAKITLDSMSLDKFAPEQIDSLTDQYFERLVAIDRYRSMKLDHGEWQSSVCQFRKRYLGKNWSPVAFWVLVNSTYFVDSPEQEP